MFGTNGISDSLTRRRLRFVAIIVTIGVGALILRSGYLQIVRTEYYTKKSEDNRIRPVRLIPPRGVLYDRYGGESLADNETAFDVCVAPNQADLLRNPDGYRHEILRRLNLAPEEILERLKESRNATFEPVVIKEDIDKNTAAYLAENRPRMQEVVVQARPRRRYKRLAAHVIGYTAPVSERDLENGYALNDVIGKTGVEAQYEDLLKGDLGWKMVEVNAYGHIIRELPLSARAEPGQSLKLTLDLSLQRKAEELLEGKRGAVVAVDPRNGDILALASKPDFDPNIFAGKCSEEDWNELMSNHDNPLMNRVLMGEYPPGSTFKIVTATAALEEGKIDRYTSFYCNGSFRLGGHTFRCHKPSGHGTVSIHRGIVESCNVFFYNVAYRKNLTVSTMHKYAQMYGLGKQTGIDLPGERQGFIPAKSKYAGDKVNMCIGQGAVLVTPLQMVNLISVIANRGFSYKPHVASLPQGSKPEVLVDLRGKVSPGSIEIIRNALKEVVERGYSQQANLPDYHTAGKTGTAQNPHGDEHAWFIGFGTFENPQIAVAVIVENAGRGSQFAAPIAGEIFAEYFYRDKATLAERQGNANLPVASGH